MTWRTPRCCVIAFRRLRGRAVLFRRGDRSDWRFGSPAADCFFRGFSSRVSECPRTLSVGSSKPFSWEPSIGRRLLQHAFHWLPRLPFPRLPGLVTALLLHPGPTRLWAALKWIPSFMTVRARLPRPFKGFGRLDRIDNNGEIWKNTRRAVQLVTKREDVSARCCPSRWVPLELDLSVTCWTPAVDIARLWDPSLPPPSILYNHLLRFNPSRPRPVDFPAPWNPHWMVDKYIGGAIRSIQLLDPRTHHVVQRLVLNNRGQILSGDQADTRAQLSDNPSTPPLRLGDDIKANQQEEDPVAIVAANLLHSSLLQTDYHSLSSSPTLPDSITTATALPSLTRTAVPTHEPKSIISAHLDTYIVHLLMSTIAPSLLAGNMTVASAMDSLFAPMVAYLVLGYALPKDAAPNKVVPGEPPPHHPARCLDNGDGKRPNLAKDIPRIVPPSTMTPTEPSNLFAPSPNRNKIPYLSLRETPRYAVEEPYCTTSNNASATSSSSSYDKQRLNACTPSPSPSMQTGSFAYHRQPPPPPLPERQFVVLQLLRARDLLAALPLILPVWWRKAAIISYTPGNQLHDHLYGVLKLIEARCRSVQVGLMGSPVQSPDHLAELKQAEVSLIEYYAMATQQRHDETYDKNHFIQILSGAQLAVVLLKQYVLFLHFLSTTVQATVVLLGQHVHLQDAVRADVLASVDSSLANGVNGRPHLSVLHAVVLDTIRLFPAMPSRCWVLASGEEGKDDTRRSLPKDVVVPCLFSPYVAGRWEGVWGDGDPTQLNVDRWQDLDPSSLYKMFIPSCATLPPDVVVHIVKRVVSCLITRVSWKYEGESKKAMVVPTAGSSVLGLHVESVGVTFTVRSSSASC